MSGLEAGRLYSLASLTTLGRGRDCSARLDNPSLSRVHVILSRDGCRFTLDKDGLPVPTRDDGTPETFEILASTTAGLSEKDSSIDWVSEGLYGLGTKKRVEQPGQDG